MLCRGLAARSCRLAVMCPPLRAAPPQISAGFDPVTIADGKRGTCELHTKRIHTCNDGMTGTIDQVG